MADPAYIPSESVKKVAEKIGEARFDGGNWYKYTREAHEFLLCFYAAMDLPRSAGQGYDTPPKVEVSGPPLTIPVDGAFKVEGAWTPPETPQVPEMAERCALALAKHCSADTSINWVMNEYRRQVSLVIQTMREPTNDMWEKSRKHMDSESSNGVWWRSMIDAALGE